MSPDPPEQQLNQLLQRLESKDGLELSSSSLNAQLAPLVEAFLPSASLDCRSLGFLILTKIVSNARGKIEENSDEAIETVTQNLARLFRPSIESCLSTTEATSVESALGLLTGLFQVDPATASEIFTKDGFSESVMDAPDLFEGDVGSRVRRSVAGLLSQAASNKASREIVLSHALTWLQTNSRQTGDITLRASAANALTKLLKGAGGDEANGASGTDSAAEEQEEERLAGLMKSLVLDLNKSTSSDSPSQAVLEAIEGLAYVSSEPAVKELLSQDNAFLKALFTLTPPPKKRQTGPKPVVNIDSEFLPPQSQPSTALLYGVAVIISSLASFRPQLTEEEQQVERLKSMTKEGARTGAKLAEPAQPASEDLDGDKAVKQRCKRLLKNGVASALSTITARAQSESVRRALGRAFLGLVEEKENRGKIIQSGGGKSLLRIAQASFKTLEAHKTDAKPKAASKFNSVAVKGLDTPDLIPIQALAKLAITSSPILLFGPDASDSIDAIRPFSHLLLNPSSTLLQRFEALMALTNVASLGPPIASRVAAYKEDGLGSVMMKAEMLLLDDNTMVRRAATELLCNLVASDEGWERYTGEKPDGTTEAVSETGVVQRLRIMLAMADVEDDPTRLAASGALAMLSSASNVGTLLLTKMENGPSKVSTVLVSLIHPESDEDREPSSPEIQSQLAYRAIICLRNVLCNSKLDKASTSAVVAALKESKMPEALVIALTKPKNSGNQEMLAAGGEALKWMLERGIQIVV